MDSALSALSAVNLTAEEKETAMKRVFTLPMVVLLLALGAGMAPAQSGYDLFQKALVKERAEGNVQEAIHLYQRIVREHAGNRALVAKALVQIGQCYEKLGKGEARKAYELVLRNYADQQDAAAEARARLAALAPPAGRNGPAMTARRIWAGPDLDVQGRPSPDGHYFTFTDWETGDLAVRDLLTSQNRRLTNKGSWFASNEFAFFSIVSPDGKQVAYSWYNKDNTWELRLLPLDSTSETAKPRILFHNEQTEYIRPDDWSPDGKQVLALLEGKDRTYQIVLVSTADGSARALKTLDWRHVATMAFSPDGRYIVYDFPPKELMPERDIFLLAVDGSREVALVQHPADDHSPHWSPDGTRVLFASDRTGSMGLWAIQVNDGKPQGNPELIKPDIGRAYLRGFTRKGSFYYSVDAGTLDIYIAQLDLPSGKLASSPVAATQRYLGSNAGPAWSPDGEYLAFLRRDPRRLGLGSRVIVIRSLKTGEERELSLDTTTYTPPVWSPDGRAFLIVGYDGKKGRRGIYKVDAQTGQSTPIVQVETGADVLVAGWAAGGKAVCYVRYDRKSFGVLSRDLENGKETEIYGVPSPAYVNGLAVSPNDRRLAFIVGDPSTRSGALVLIPASGGEARELLRLRQPESIRAGSLAWTRDGRELIFITEGPGLEGPRPLQRIAVEGGQARRLELAMPNLRHISFHPDGRRIAFEGGEKKGEVWVMENFLPALRAAR